MANDVARLQGITIALTASLLVSVSPQVAQAYASTDSPAAQLQILRGAIADGSAIPLVRREDGSFIPVARARKDGTIVVAGPGWESRQ